MPRPTRRSASSSRQSGIPYLPMSMAKGLLPDDHAQSAAAARSLVLQEADVVHADRRAAELAALPWRSATRGTRTPKFIQVDIAADRNGQQPADCRAGGRRHRLGAWTALIERGKPGRITAPHEWREEIAERKTPEPRQDGQAPRGRQDRAPDEVPRRVACDPRRAAEHPDINVVNEGANTLDYARSIIDMAEPRQRFDSGTWGVMGIGMGFAIAAAVESGKPVVAIEGDSAFGFSGMELETICRYKLPVLHRRLQQQRRVSRRRREPAGGDLAPTVSCRRQLRQDDRGIRRRRLPRDHAGRS